MEVEKDKKNAAAREVGKPLGVHAAVIDRFLRDEIKPSIEMATQLAEAHEVHLGYQAGSTDGLLEKKRCKPYDGCTKTKRERKATRFRSL